jgi:hypothetical protein
MIVQDEQLRLPQALESVAFCDEIVVVDGGSTDRTVEIARAAGARVIENPWPGFAAQRNVALDAASGEWAFELDADERVSPALRASIESFLLDSHPSVDIAVCPLRNRFLGAAIGPSAKYPAYRSRLFRRAAYRHDESRAVHEGIEPRERPAVLSGDLEHHLAGTPHEALIDAWRYACLESSHIAPARGPRAYLVGVALRPLAKAAYRLIVDRGWRDGWRGLFKIWLDATSDALVWLLVLERAARRRGASPPASPSSGPDGHFGRRPARPAKVIGLATRGPAEQAARAWLGALRSAGIDTALVCDCEQGADCQRGEDRQRGADSKQGADCQRGEAHELSDGEIPTEMVSSLWPLATMRAIDVEMQVRTAHAVVAFGRRAQLVRSLLPHSLRPSIAGVDANVDPALAVERLHAASERLKRAAES